MRRDASLIISPDVCRLQSGLMIPLMSKFLSISGKKTNKTKQKKKPGLKQIGDGTPWPQRDKKAHARQYVTQRLVTQLQREGREKKQKERKKEKQKERERELTRCQLLG